MENERPIITTAIGSRNTIYIMSAVNNGKSLISIVGNGWNRRGEGRTIWININIARTINPPICWTGKNVDINSAPNAIFDPASNNIGYPTSSVTWFVMLALFLFWIVAKIFGKESLLKASYRINIFMGITFILSPSLTN